MQKTFIWHFKVAPYLLRSKHLYIYTHKAHCRTCLLTIWNNKKGSDLGVFPNLKITCHTWLSWPKTPSPILGTNRMMNQLTYSPYFIMCINSGYILPPALKIQIIRLHTTSCWGLASRSSWFLFYLYILIFAGACLLSCKVAVNVQKSWALARKVELMSFWEQVSHFLRGQIPAEQNIHVCDITYKRIYNSVFRLENIQALDPFPPAFHLEDSRLIPAFLHLQIQFSFSFLSVKMIRVVEDKQVGAKLARGKHLLWCSLLYTDTGQSCPFLRSC